MGETFRPERRRVLSFLLLLISLSVGFVAVSHPENLTEGVHLIRTVVPTGSDGKTIEQRLVERRLRLSTQALGPMFAYVGSSYTGHLIYQSVVEGKVVSSGKRLSPSTVIYWKVKDGYDGAIPVRFGNETYHTDEILSDDGTYGRSIPYLYWWDVDGTYFQQFVTDDVFIVISSRPIDFHTIAPRVLEELRRLRSTG